MAEDNEHHFRDALVYLQEAYDHMEDDLGDPDEVDTRDRLIQLCSDIAGRYEEDFKVY